ncbi:MAG TPA: lysophospholipid acyltransferase family protein [Microlunatus sp.]
MTDQSGMPPGGRRRSSSSARGLRKANTEPAEKALIAVISIINAIARPLTLRDWRGQENIPRTGGILLVANHISNVDPIAVGQYVAFAGRWPRFLGKASLFQVPVIGRIITACGQIPVERGTHSAVHALQAAITAIEAGKTVVIYPEGTVTFDEQLWPMVAKSGAARIALQTACPVIPIGQWGAQDIMWGKKVHLPHLLPRKTLRLVAGEPVRLDDLREAPITPKAVATATDRIMDAITELVVELRQEPAPPDRYDPRRSRQNPTGPEYPDDRKTAT